MCIIDGHVVLQDFRKFKPGQCWIPGSVDTKKQEGSKKLLSGEALFHLQLRSAYACITHLFSSLCFLGFRNRASHYWASIACCRVQGVPDEDRAGQLNSTSVASSPCTGGFQFCGSVLDRDFRDGLARLPCVDLLCTWI